MTRTRRAGSGSRRGRSRSGGGSDGTPGRRGAATGSARAALGSGGGGSGGAGDDPGGTAGSSPGDGVPGGGTPVPVPGRRWTLRLSAVAAIVAVVVGSLFLGMAMFTEAEDPPLVSPMADMLGPDGSPTAPFPVFTLTRRASATPAAEPDGGASPQLTTTPSTAAPGASGPAATVTPTRPPTVTPVPRPTPPVSAPLAPGMVLAALVGSAYLTPLPAPSG